MKLYKSLEMKLKRLKDNVQLCFKQLNYLRVYSNCKMALESLCYDESFVTMA